MIARLVLLCILFVWNGCYGCCSAEESGIPKSVRKVLALEQRQARIRAARADGVLTEDRFVSEEEKIAKEMSKALLINTRFYYALQDWKRYFEIARPGDEEIFVRLANVQSEESAVAKEEFKLSWLEEHTLNQGAKNADARQFREDQHNRLAILGAIRQKCVENLSFDGYKSYVTDNCGIVITNENVLSLGNSKELVALFPPVIISMISEYMPGRIFNHAPNYVPLHAIDLVWQGDRIVGIGASAEGGCHIFASESLRYEDTTVSGADRLLRRNFMRMIKPLSMTFIPEEELDILVALRRKDLTKRIEQYRALNPGFPDNAVAEGVLAQEKARLAAVGKQHNLSAQTIQRANEDTLIAVPSWEEIQLMRDRSEGALYTKKPMTLPVGYQVVTVLDEQKGDEE